MSRRALALLALVPLVAACTQGAKSGRRLELPSVPDPMPLSATPAPPLPDLRWAPERIEGTPSVRVVWEALAVERDRYQHPNLQGLTTYAKPEDLEVIVLNASYVATPDQDREDKARPPSGRIARVSDADMNAFLQGLEQIGFFRYAQPTAAVRGLFGSDRARGRVTLDRGGDSWTLLSLRGLGLQANTREIPAIYAAAKEAVSGLKNSASAMRIKAATVGTRDAKRYRLGDDPSVPTEGTAPGSGPGPASAPPK